jgi:hypothetical protein
MRDERPGGGTVAAPIPSAERSARPLAAAIQRDTIVVTGAQPRAGLRTGGAMSMGIFYLVIAAPLVVVVLLILQAAASQRRRANLLTTTGRGVIGRVLAVGSDSDGMTSPSFWVKVEYDYDADSVTTTIQLSERDQQRYRVGQRVGLTYAPSRPRFVRLDPPEWQLPPAS